MPSSATAKPAKRSSPTNGVRAAKAATTMSTKSAARKTAPRHTALERYCSVARTVEILSDAWTFLVLRESYFGNRRFEEIQRVLGLPRTTLTKRLVKLEAIGLLRKVRYLSRPVRHEYRFTDKGRDLYQSMLALLKFGDTWLANGAEPPLQLIHKTCGHAFSPTIACSSCGAEVKARRVHYRDGPGAGSSLREANRMRSRRASDPSVLERGRPCSVARTLQIIGDRWTFLVIREAFFGVRRFDEWQVRLGIASNILADRLTRLTAQGIMVRQSYQQRPERYDYRLTEMGLDLYGPMIVMMHWGDRWLSDNQAPLTLRHRDCGQDFYAHIVCSHCHQNIDPHAVDFVMHYTLPREGGSAEDVAATDSRSGLTGPTS